MQKMNGKTLKIEIASCGGHDRIDCASFNKALNAWARKRRIEWPNSFKRPGQYQAAPADSNFATGEQTGTSQRGARGGSSAV